MGDSRCDGRVLRAFNDTSLEQAISMSLTIVNWCPSDDCDPCSCHWVPMIDPPILPRISNPGHSDDGAIDQVATFCGAPFWGIGLQASASVTPGDLVTGYLFGGGSGLGSSAVLDGQLLVDYEGATAFSISLGGATITSFGTDGTVWSANVRVSVPSCIMLDPAKDRTTRNSNAVVGFVNCVLPYTGPIPDIAFSIAPTFNNTGTNETVSVFPSVFLHVKSTIDPV